MNVSKYNIMLPRNIAKIIKELGLKNNAVAQKAGRAGSAPGFAAGFLPCAGSAG